MATHAVLEAHCVTQPLEFVQIDSVRIYVFLDALGRSDLDRRCMRGASSEVAFAIARG